MTVIANITTAATITVTKKSQNPQKEEQNKNIVRKELDEKRKQGMKFWWIPLHSAKKKKSAKKIPNIFKRKNAKQKTTEWKNDFTVFSTMLLYPSG